MVTQVWLNPCHFVCDDDAVRLASVCMLSLTCVCFVGVRRVRTQGEVLVLDDIWWGVDEGGSCGTDYRSWLSCEVRVFRVMCVRWILRVGRWVIGTGYDWWYRVRVFGVCVCDGSCG